MAKLTEDDVREIKLKLMDGCRMTPIAKEYGVHWNTIYHIKLGKVWKHIIL